MRASRISLFVLQLPPRFRRVAPFHSHAQAICSELGRERAEREGTNPLRLCEPDFAKKKLLSLRFPFVEKVFYKKRRRRDNYR